VFQYSRKQNSATLGVFMESAAKSDVRRLCKAVWEEQDNTRLQALLDELLQILEERQLGILLL
jgi:hypothetical protein